MGCNMKYLKKEDYFCDTDYHIGMGLFAIALILALLIPCLAVYFLSGSGSPPGIRGTVSGAWHHTKCLVRFCDEDGRCPVWIEKFSKCYMLDSEDRKKFKDGVGFEWEKRTFEIYIREKYD